MTDTPAVVDVSTPTNECRKTAELLHLPRVLMGGTDAMRKSRERYLPREKAESADAYQIRLYRTVLFNAFAKTVEDMTGKVFNKPIILEENVPPQIVEWCENIDLAGRHINVFAKDVFKDGQIAGIGYILVDMPPKVTRLDGQTPTLADEQAVELRPYLVFIPPDHVIGWKSQVINGAPTITQFRFRETVKEPIDEFNEKDVEQIRVLEPGRWRTFRLVDTKDEAGPAQGWEIYEEGTSSLNKVTIVPFYTNRTDFMLGKSPHENLAHLNVAHWQSDSDQRNILHVARCPILFYAGKADNDAVVIGANSLTFSSNPDAKLTYVEHDGNAIDSGDKDIQNIELRMQAHGLQLLIPKPGQTATGEIRDDAKENAPLAMMARGLGDALELCFALMAEFGGIELVAGEGKGAGEVQVNSDFGIQSGAALDLQWLVQAAIAGEISRETLWFELQRRGTLSDSFDPKVEEVRIQKQLDAAPELDTGPGRGMFLNLPPKEVPSKEVPPKEVPQEVLSVEPPAPTES
jgi:Domain of unknown function (DUF4055)